jgi:ABC-2 type transport system ATP-binding protein
MILSTNNLSKTYRSREGKVDALTEFDLSIQAGEIFGLLGPNGAGKTTAVKTIMGFLHPTSGSIEFKGTTMTTTQPRVGIGYLPESFRPNPNVSVGEYIGLQCRLAGMAQPDIGPEVSRLLSLVGMDKVPGRKISNLSKGMGQRVGLAQAFAGSPAMLILDEPTSGLDPLGRREVIDLLLAMKDQGKTIFFCSHILSEVERLCDRIGILVGGELRFVGTANEFLDKWQAPDLEEAFIQEARCA